MCNNFVKQKRWVILWPILATKTKPDITVFLSVNWSNKSYDFPLANNIRQQFWYSSINQQYSYMTIALKLDIIGFVFVIFCYYPLANLGGIGGQYCNFSAKFSPCEINHSFLLDQFQNLS